MNPSQNPSREEKARILFERLREARRSQTEPDAGPGWQARVMQAVARSPVPSLTDERPARETLPMERLVWRTALAASLVAAVLVGYLLVQPASGDLVASPSFDDPAETLVASLSD
ncbi:MAG: hypothetical protein KGO52_15030 [Nitrospirota bacterium]|nr:hypothetical protein [Nitrospirota bacterium]MDE3226387.1 hypothetical protein [Nitrospirota bacterium]MDE3244023.1 hypothetical protein [Nitrospirota bacterium]